MLFLISFASALEFDNVKSYDTVTREVTIHNTFLGIKTGEVGKARLNTPLNVKVAPGYQKVAEFDLWAYEDYNDALKQFTFKDMKNGKVKINRDYDLKWLSYENIKINDYDYIYIGLSKNETKEYEYKKVGSHLEVRKVWNKITPADLRKNDKLTIGIFTNVKLGDYVDWIPMIYGVKVEEWATWEGDLKAGLVAYYKLDNTTGDVIDIHAGNDGTATGVTRGVIGKINNSFEWTASNNVVTLPAGLRTTGTMTWAGWIKTTDSDNENKFITDSNSGVGKGLQLANNKLCFNVYTGSGFACGGNNAFVSTTTINDGEWHHYATGLWGDRCVMYVDGVLEANVSAGTTTSNDNGGTFNLGGYGSLTPAYESSVIGLHDEVGIWNRTLTLEEVVFLNDSHTYDDDGFSNKPIIELNLPEDNINYTVSPLQVNFSCYASDDINLTSVGLYIDGSLDQLNATGLNNTNYTFSKTLTEGNYNWTCEGTNNESQTTKATERKFNIHTTAPNVTVHYPNGTFNYHLGGDSLKLNWTIAEPGQNLTTHIKNCTYEYNGVITELNNTVCTEVNETTFIPVPGIYNITFTVTDEFDLQASEVKTWNIKVFEINQTYNNETTEGSLETFLANIRLGSGYSISDAVLINYNETENTGQSFSSGSNTILRKTDLLIPNVATDTNVTFYWNITLSDSTNINLTSKNQTIFNLVLDNCTTGTNELFNFTVIDEELQTILSNATIETAINIYDKTGTELILNYSKLFNGINPLRICLNKNISNSSVYSVDTIVRYENTGHAIEYYNIVNQTLTNGTESQIITLYDLNLTDSTDFQLSFTGSDFLPVENALVYVDRQYISENKFKTVELPKTDYNGQSVLHLVRNDVIYNIRIIKDGVVLGNFENLVAFCDDFTIGDCNIELNAFDSVESVFNVDEALGIIYTSPVYNETANTISFNFLTEDGTAKTVLLNVTRNDIFGNRSICSSSLTSSGGTLTCDIDPNLDESVLMVSVYVDGVLTVFGSVELDTDNYGVAGYLVMFVMAISFIFMFSGSKTGVLISIGLTFAGSLGMGIVSGSLIGIGASGIWLLVIIFVGIYKLNKERQA